MSELRAPDPTLAAIDSLVVVKFEGLPVAHLLDDDDPYSGLRCDAPDDGSDVPMGTRHAAYIAVPCPECFPDAPEAGRRPCLIEFCRSRDCTGIKERRLAWQVQA